MNRISCKLLLADDDIDDCIFFQEALSELPVDAALTTVNDGVELMELLAVKHITPFDMLFLDLNMPRKNGMECLSEIRLINEYNNLPVIIFSTSYDVEMVNMLFEKGAHYYIRKPGDFSKLRESVYTAISSIVNSKGKPSHEKFVIHKG